MQHREPPPRQSLDQRGLGPTRPEQVPAAAFQGRDTNAQADKDFSDWSLTPGSQLPETSVTPQ